MTGNIIVKIFGKLNYFLYYCSKYDNMIPLLNIFTVSFYRSIVLSFYRSIVQKNILIINMMNGGIIVANLLDIKKIHHFTEARFRNFETLS